MTSILDYGGLPLTADRVVRGVVGDEADVTAPSYAGGSAPPTAAARQR
jgi:hypothetical protein